MKVNALLQFMYFINKYYFPSFSLAWNVYGEISVTPIQNLEWYFEAELGDDATETSKVLGFNASTGITWYLPAL